MKQNKHTVLYDDSAFISPIAPRVNSLDGIGSLFNLTGNYYNIDPGLDALCKASRHISGISSVWGNVGNDLFKAANQFAESNRIGKISIFKYDPPKFSNNLWGHLLNPKEY